MEKITRNWSAIQDYEGGGNFGQRAFYTRQDWIEQCFEWQFGCGMPDLEDMDEEEREYYDYLCKGTDESLMAYIEDMWEIQIRETTWLKVGNQCYWNRGDDGVVVKILEVPLNSDGELEEFTDILCEYNGKSCKLPLFSLFGLTDEVCPKCGKPLYVSDLCSYPYVCLRCDENFYHNEAI